MSDLRVGDVVKYPKGTVQYIVIEAATKASRGIIVARHTGDRYPYYYDSPLTVIHRPEQRGEHRQRIEHNTPQPFIVGEFVEHAERDYICGYVISSDASKTSIRTASGRQFVSGTHAFARTTLCEDFKMSNSNNAGFITGLSNTDLLRLAAAKLVIATIIAENPDARLVEVTFDEDRAAENTKKRYDYLCPIADVDVGAKGFVLAPDGQYKVVTVKNVHFLDSDDIVRRMATTGYQNLSAILGIRNPTNSEPLSTLFSKKIEELRAATAVQQVNQFANMLLEGAGQTAPSPAAASENYSGG